jgi:ABC-2 type transport system permease protein
LLIAFSGLYFAIPPHSGLAQFGNFFPIRHLILAIFAPFNEQAGVSPWAWHDLGVIAIWGVAGAVVALRRWEWAPRRSK